jgi:hypothetical protein
MEASFHLPSGGGPLVDSSGGYTSSELASILSSACRRGDLLAAFQMRSHGDFSSVNGDELRQTEALVRGQPYHMPSGAIPHALPQPYHMPFGAGVSSTDSVVTDSVVTDSVVTDSVVTDSVGLHTQALLGARRLPTEGLPTGRLAEGVGAALPTPLPFSPSRPLETAPSRALPSTAAVHAALHRCGIIPVVTIDDVSHAVPLARALVAGGISVIELTLRTAAGEASIREIASHVPEMLVGAGTVLSTVQAC